VREGPADDDIQSFLESGYMNDEQLIYYVVENLTVSQMRCGTEKQCWMVMDISNSVTHIKKLDESSDHWFAVRLTMLRRRMVKNYRWSLDSDATMGVDEIDFGFSVERLSDIPYVVGGFIRQHLNIDDFYVADGWVVIDFPIEGETPREKSIISEPKIIKHYKQF